jgi:hypothetical protein
LPFANSALSFLSHAISGGLTGSLLGQNAASFLDQTIADGLGGTPFANSVGTFLSDVISGNSFSSSLQSALPVLEQTVASNLASTDFGMQLGNLLEQNLSSSSFLQTTEALFQQVAGANLDSTLAQNLGAFLDQTALSDLGNTSFATTAASLLQQSANLNGLDGPTFPQDAAAFLNNVVADGFGDSAFAQTAVGMLNGTVGDGPVAETVLTELNQDLNGLMGSAGTAQGAPAIVFLSAPLHTTAGSAFAVTVTALDQDGNVLTGYPGTVSFSSSDQQAGLPANYTFTAADQGVRTFNLNLDTAGSQTITATDTVTGTVNGQATIQVTPGSVSLSTSTVSIAPATIEVGKITTVTLTAQDTYGNQEVTGGLAVAFSLGTGSAQGTFSSVTDNGDGTYTATFTGNTAGTNIITATINGQAVASTATIVCRPLIMANGQAGFSETGTWASYADGYNDSLLWTPNSGSSTPTATASWQGTGLVPGTYTVAATWDAMTNHATNAPYSIYDGNTLLTTVYANQTQSPVGSTAGGIEFQTLAIVPVDSGTLRVVLGNNADGVVVANAVEVSLAAAPTIDLNWSGGGISGSPSTIAATTPFQVSGTYTISSTFAGGLAPSAFTIGYYASTNGQLSGATLLGRQTIAAGQAAGQYTVTSPSLQFPTAGTYYLLADLNDTNSIVETNTANNVTAAAQQVTVTGSFIVANGQAGFTDTGTWYSYPDGYSGNLQWSYNSGSSTPTATASWQVTELAPGTYTVAATWDANANHATNAPFSIYDGNTLLTTVTADQSQTPVGTTAGGVVFQTLTTVTVSSGTLTVVLGNNADGVVVANAIEITLV